MNTQKNNKKFYIVFGLICYFLVLLISLHMGNVVTTVPDQNFFEVLAKATEHFSKNPFNVFPISSQSFQYLKIMTVLFLFIALVVYVNEEQNKHFDSSKTSGSSKWNTDFEKYNKKFRDMSQTEKKKKSFKNIIVAAKKTKDNSSITEPEGLKGKKEKVLDEKIDLNMIMNQDVFLSMDTRKTRRNNNVVIFGGSGTGKSRFVVKPNALQANSSFVFTDPSGEILESVGNFLEKQGYKIKIFNLVEMQKSNCYNPFEYIRDEAGVMSLVNCLIQNTSDPNAQKGDPFWEKSEIALLMALIYYLISERPKEERNFSSVMKLLRAAEINEMDPNAKSDVDRIFEQLEKKDKDHIAVKQWKIFKLAGGRLAKSILITAAVRLSAFNIQAVADLTKKDDLELGKIGDKKTALFVIIPTADSTYNFLVSLMYSQLFDTLYFHAENECPALYGEKRLPHHIRFMLDEFANIGKIPEFEKKLATMRKYEISCTIILQSISQLKGMYEKDWAGIVGNCDTTIFLGGKDPETNKGISDDLGDATIIVRDNSRSRGRNSNSSLSFKRSARKLMDPAEIQKIPDDECIVFIRGLQPFRGKKYVYEKHRNYKYTGDADDKNKFVNTLDNSEEISYQKIDQELEIEKTKKYTEALEHPDEPSKQVIGKPKPLEEALKMSKTKDIAIIDASPGISRYDIEEDDSGEEIWEMGGF